MKKISLSLIMICGLLVFAYCTKSDSGNGSSNPEEFCNEAGCAVSEINKQRCIEWYYACMAASPDAKDDECVAGALAICK